MERIVNAFIELREINKSCEINNSDIDNDIESCIRNINNEKVCMPIIGKFSSGKSALCNGLLGCKILKEDITPETSIPTEIVYGEHDYIWVYEKNENKENFREISIKEYIDKEFLSKETNRIRLHLDNDFLKEISNVMVVDMPGFESGIEIHNIAINNYIDRSQVYIFALPADDLTLRSDIINILLEICNYKKPIYFVITKCDKVSDEIMKYNIEELKKKIKRYISGRDFKIVYTSVVNGDIEGVKEIFYETQDKSKSIIMNKYIEKFNTLSDITVKFLEEFINNSELNESELIEKEERLISEIKKTSENVLKINEKFNLSIEKCINDIHGDLNMALHSNESNLVTMALNGNDISGKLNSIVRSSVTNSIQRRFMPLVEKYIDKMSGAANIDVNIFAGVTMGVSVESGIGGAVAVGVLSGFILGPVLGVILGCLVGFFRKKAAEKKREEQKAKIRSEFNNNIFPNVMSQVKSQVEIEIKKKVMEISDAVEKNIETNESIMRKALEDVRRDKEKETEENEIKIINVKKSINRIGEIKNELCL